MTLEVAAWSATGRRTVLALISSLMIVAALPGSADVEVACEQPISNVTQHVPIYYKAISSLGVGERRVLFASLSSDLKAGLWRYQLSTYLSKHGKELTAEQRSVIADGLAILNAGIFNLTDQSPASAAIRLAVDDLRERAANAFERDVAIALFARIGGEIRAVSRGPSVSDDDIASTGKRPPGKVETLKPACTCSYHDDWCGSPYGCTYACGCSGSSWGCGTLWSNPCNGTCYDSSYGLPPYCP